MFTALSHEPPARAYTRSPGARSARPQRSWPDRRHHAAPGFVGPMSAITLGALAAFPSYFGLLWRAKTNLDDSLDVVAAHGLGGTVGALLTGVFAQKAFNGVADGLLFGNPGQLGIQAAAVLSAIVYSGVMTAMRPLDSTSRCTVKKRTFTQRARNHRCTSLQISNGTLQA